MPKLSRALFGTLATSLVIALSSCASDEPGEADQATADEKPAPAYAYEFDGSGANVSKSQFGKDWPLTVKSGRVNCNKEGSGSVVAIFTANNNTQYALNGVAKAKETMEFYGLKQVDPIWADDPQTGGKRDIGVLIDVCSPLVE